MKEVIETPKRSALKTALIYLVVAGLWIFLSDRILGLYVSGRVLTDLSILKGLGFVIFTSFLLYFLVRRDLNRIYQAEEEWRVLFDSVNDAIYLFTVRENGLPGQFMNVNEAAVQRMGYAKEELLTLTPWDLTKPELHARMREFLAQLKNGGRATFENILVTKDGREIPVEVSGKMLQIGDKTAVVSIVRDITERKKSEEERRNATLTAERDKRHFYKETILAVTEGKFELGEQEDVETWIRKRDLAIQVPGAEQLAEARRSAIDYCIRQGLSPERASEFELAIGEAIGNAVKHAGSGWVYAGRTPKSVWVAVQDNGTGIDTFAIPKVALTSGYTTKASMGLGYTMILAVSDHVKLFSGPNGTTVVMEKRLRETPEVEARIAAHIGIV